MHRQDRCSEDRSKRSSANLHSLIVSAFACLIFQLSTAAPGACSPYLARVGAIRNILVIDGRTAAIVPGRLGSRRARFAASTIEEGDVRSTKIERVGRRKWSVTTSGGRLILLVTRADSREVGGTVEGLARDWSKSIDNLLSMPALTIGSVPRPLVTPSEGFRCIFVGGAALPEQITAQDLSTSITSATFDPGTRTLTVEGLKPGFATVTITATDRAGGTATLDLPILVENRAGSIDSSVVASVFGSPATSDTVIQAIRTAVCQSVALQPGAVLEVIRQPACSDLASGGETIAPVTVRAAGSDLIPVEQVVDVHVVNESGYPAETAQALYYSNSPETVKHPQSLFDAFIPAVDHPVRLVFHHQNCSAGPMLVRVELDNVGHTPAMLRLMRGLAGAGPNPVDAGARAGEVFLHEWQDNSGELLTIPGQSRLELYVLRAGPGDMASGIFEIAQTAGLDHTLLLRVDAEPIGDEDLAGLDSLVDVADPDTAALTVLPLSTAYNISLASAASSDQIYATPSVAASGSYSVGGPWMHLVIGTDSPLARLSGGGSALAGNYGVIYEITLSLTNPTQAARQIGVSFSSDAGDASGVFTLAGERTIVVDDLYPPNERQIAQVTLAPGATQMVQIQTIPLSGSAYPAALTAHAL